jgi:LacI family transcriptional regulator
MSRQVTIIDVAKEAGVSFATVSRVLNDGVNVKPEKRERVLRAIKRLGYTTNLQARSLRGGRSHLIGLVVRDLGTAYIGEIIRGVDLELAANKYDMMLYTTHRRQTQERAYVTALTRSMTDGLLLVLPRHPETYLKTLRQRKFPHVLIDHQGIDERGPAVGATNRAGAYDATRYLLALGHRRIGFITGAMSLGCSRERLDGYHAALRDHGVAAEPELVREGDFSQPRGYAEAIELMNFENPPTAIFASNDVMAFGAMEAARERGLRIPGDISILGFDDIPQAAQVHPPLTTVRQPLEEMGRRAAKMLLEIMENLRAAPREFSRISERRAEKIELPTELVVRESTRALR